LFSQRGVTRSTAHRIIGNDPTDLVSGWTDLILLADPHNVETRDAQACGWPSFAFRSVTLIESPHGTPKSLGTLDIGLSTRTLPWPSPIKPPHYLSVRPIWPGFAINTIFYAAIVWVLFFAPGMVRRRLRRKRGQCAACGYSLRGIAGGKCPECGASIPSPSRERARVWVKRDELSPTSNDSQCSTHPPTPSLNGGGEK
jgi:hypothetical protein